MEISITQFFLTLFLLFASSRVLLRFRGGILSFFSFIFWISLFGFALLLVLFPIVSGSIARFLGVGRGADVVIYVSITLLFYLIFRAYIFLEDIKHDITEIVKKQALKDAEEKQKK